MQGQTALPDWLEKLRATWAKTVEDEERPATWYANQLIWMDPCSTIVPGAHRPVRTYVRNLDKRVWWFLVFTRGKVRFPIMDDDWKQNGEGMATMVEQLPGLLTNMLGGAPKPRVIFTDRGPGLYQGCHGAIVNSYNKALEKHGLRAFAGTNASWQPPDLADLLLHETVAGWVRKYFRDHPIKWCNDQDKNYDQFVSRLKKCEKFINKRNDLKGLSLSFPRRVKQLRMEKGRRLRF